MKTALAFPILFMLATLASGATIFVPDDYQTIQEAIDAAANGDEVVVRPGIYIGQVNLLAKAITVRSEEGAEKTILDGNQSGDGPVATFGTAPHSGGVLDGFTITNGLGIHGGAIICNGAGTIKNNIITKNAATCCGGGIKTWSETEQSVLIVNNLIYDNHVDHAGGGIRCQGDSTPIILNNTIFGNSAGNWGGGIEHRKDAAAVVVNTILWNNTAPKGLEIYDTSTTEISVTYSDVEGGWNGTGNANANPLFVDSANGDFHLTWDSPCRHAGDNGSGLIDTDFEGDPRIALGAVDMGADEYWHHLYFVGSVTPGDMISARVIGWPNGCTKLLMGSGIKNPPLSTVWGDFYLEAPVNLFYLGIIPANGVLVIDVSIPTVWQQGETHPLQAFIGSPLWPSSRLTNLVVLTVQ